MSIAMLEALKLADAALSGANMNMAVVKRKIDEALAEQPAQAKMIPQYRKRGCTDWYDGYADHEDGRGPYEERIVYTAPPAPVVPEGWGAALHEAHSVCNSVSLHRDRRFEREGRVYYLQTEEWCKWLQDEVGPQLRKALAAASAVAAKGVES